MRIGWLALVLAGCAATDKDSGDAPPVSQDTDTAGPVCEGTAPVLTELEVRDYGALYPFEDGEAPALLVNAIAQDEDRDLHRMNLVLWWDDVIDGVVDTSGAGEEAGVRTMNDEEECTSANAQYGIVFEVDGTRFGFATEYEFAAEVYDAAGLVSNQVVASGVTPGLAAR